MSLRVAEFRYESPPSSGVKEKNVVCLCWLVLVIIISDHALVLLTISKLIHVCVCVCLGVEKRDRVIVDLVVSSRCVLYAVIK
jgi:hypothetical protein